jgi:tRNA A37 threonylcarbamoyladenosine synthetase subunit TsaC/SUA5/YrdC
LIADIVINGGYGKNEASTIVECTGDEIKIVSRALGRSNGNLLIACKSFL